MLSLFAVFVLGISVMAFAVAGVAASSAKADGADLSVRPMSTTGEDAAVVAPGSTLLTGAAYKVVIQNVPTYIWQHGCGPTAAGMVVGYFDYAEFEDLVVGDAMTQTANVNAMIASPEHFTDYSCPIDTFRNIIPDKSQLGGAHPSNCLGDWMHTSWSADMLPYGWSYFDMMDDAYLGYVDWIDQTYGVTYYAESSQVFMKSSLTWDPLTWDLLVNEIDSNRPLVFLVDSNKDGFTDHFVPVIGYGEQAGIQMYACYNTWDPMIHWYDFVPMSKKAWFGVYGATLLKLAKAPNTDPVASFGVTPASGDTNTLFAFDASQSTDSEDQSSLLHVRWDWNSDHVWDTAWSGDKLATHEFTAPGIYSVRLQVMDTQGWTSTSEMQVMVKPSQQYPAVTIVKTSGVASSPVIWQFAPAQDGQWTAFIDNNGFSSLVLEIYDVTAGGPKVFHENIMFSKYAAYPTGMVASDPCTMTAGHLYSIVVKDYGGPVGSSVAVYTQFR
jgi:hypothetical protein